MKNKNKILIGIGIAIVVAIFGMLISTGNLPIGPVDEVEEPEEQPQSGNFSDIIEGIGIYPAKVEISGFYPGARVEQTIRIKNGRDTPSRFLVYYEDFSRDDGEFKIAPITSKEWLSVEVSDFILGPGEVKDILIIYEIPEGVEIDVEKFGFFLITQGAGQEGGVAVVIQMRVASKWLINMR